LSRTLACVLFGVVATPIALLVAIVNVVRFIIELLLWWFGTFFLLSGLIVTKAMRQDDMHRELRSQVLSLKPPTIPFSSKD
jgi:hypothetical protein